MWNLPISDLFMVGRKMFPKLQRIGIYTIGDLAKNDNVNQEWLMKFLEHDIKDEVFLRYIRRFLISGYMENMKYYESDKGTPQGGLISPILANVYLHYVLDMWFENIFFQSEFT